MKNKRLTVEYMGEELTFRELSDRVGMPAGLLRERIRYLGWPVEKAVQTETRATCKAESFYDCFECPFSDCIRSMQQVRFKDDPTKTWQTNGKKGIWE